MRQKKIKLYQSALDELDKQIAKQKRVEDGKVGGDIYTMDPSKPEVDFQILNMEER